MEKTGIVLGKVYSSVLTSLLCLQCTWFSVKAGDFISLFFGQMGIDQMMLQVSVSDAGESRLKVVMFSIKFAVRRIYKSRVFASLNHECYSPKSLWNKQILCNRSFCSNFSMKSLGGCWRTRLMGIRLKVLGSCVHTNKWLINCPRTRATRRSFYTEILHFMQISYKKKVMQQIQIIGSSEILLTNLIACVWCLWVWPIQCGGFFKIKFCVTSKAN